VLRFDDCSGQIGSTLYIDTFQSDACGRGPAAGSTPFLQIALDSTENPVSRAKKEGRLEDTTADREAELERIRREECKHSKSEARYT
jgi:hypothetical protein